MWTSTACSSLPRCCIFLTQPQNYSSPPPHIYATIATRHKFGPTRPLIHDQTQSQTDSRVSTPHRLPRLLFPSLKCNNKIVWLVDLGDEAGETRRGRAPSRVPKCSHLQCWRWWWRKRGAGVHEMWWWWLIKTTKLGQAKRSRAWPAGGRSWLSPGQMYPSWRSQIVLRC